MQDKFIEKTFLYLLALSVLLHLAVYQLVKLIPPEKKKAEQTTMVDLTDLPLPPPPGTAGHPRQPASPLPSPRRELPSKVDRFAEPLQRAPRLPLPLSPKVPAPGPKAPAQPLLPGPAREDLVHPEPGGTAPIGRGEGIFKPRPGVGTSSSLFPTARRLAQLEESYRNKYSPEVQEGGANFLNTDDIQFGSFYRRLETAVYGVWHYPREAMERGIEGTTPVRITFNRKGDVIQVDILESSGSQILDNEVLRTLKTIGPVGSLPRGYGSETLKIIAFFHYINGSGRIH